MHFDGIFDIKLKILLESQKNGKNREFLLTFYLSSADLLSIWRIFWHNIENFPKSHKTKNSWNFVYILAK